MYFYLIALPLLTGEHSRLLSEPDPGVEVPVTNTGGQADRTLLQSAVSGKTAALNDRPRLHVQCHRPSSFLYVVYEMHRKPPHVQCFYTFIQWWSVDIQ